MLMQIKLLNDVVSEIAGKPASDIVNIIFGKRDVNEFLIAKKLNLTINQIRNILYRLSNFGLVSFTRKKDKRKGWYTYFWTLNVSKSLQLLDKTLEKEINSLQLQLRTRENNRFYVCKTCRNEVNEETAMINNFACAECGEVYTLNEDKKVLEDLRIKIEKLKKYKAEVLAEEGIASAKEKESNRKRAAKKSAKEAKAKAKIKKETKKNGKEKKR